MRKYTIEITETLQKQVEVKAESITEAKIKIKEQYYKGNIVLDDSNHVGTHFDGVKSEKLKDGYER